MHDPSPRPTGVIRPAARPNTLGLSGTRLEQTLDVLDQRSATERPPSKRDFVRWPFRKATVPVTVTHPGGSTVCLRLACRNLSRGGISLLHTGFLHPGSGCRVTLPTLDGGDMTIDGMIRRVGHRAGPIHEIGIKFNSPVDIHRFLPQGDRNLLSYERVEPDSLAGQVVYLAASAIDTRIILHYCRATRLSLQVVEDTAAAFKHSADPATSLAMVEWPNAGGSAEELLAGLRINDKALPVLIITSDPVGLRRAKIVPGPTLMVLVKPVTQDQLLRAIAELQLNSRIARHAEHIAPAA